MYNNTELKIIIHYYYQLYNFRNLTGYYVASVQNASTLNMTKEEMYNFMCKELEEGCEEYPDIKAGFIGEVGSTWPIEGLYATTR